MRMLTFAYRNSKEIIRDPLTLGFGIGFPVVLLLLLSAIQANIPVNLFEISRLAPGIAVFGLSFITMFSALLISKDRGSSFFQRLYTTPMKPADFILGYTLPILPISLAQVAICYLVAIFLGLEISVNILLSLIFMIPVAVLYIALGLLFGSMLTEKQVGGICGSVLTNLSAWLSGTWFDLELVGGGFKAVAYHLPFVHAVDMSRAVLAGDLGGIFPHIWWVICYAAVCLIAAIFLFVRQMKKQ